MLIEIIQSDDQLLKIALSGKLDALGISGQELKFHAMLNSQNSPVILDFSGVTFVASMGIRMLLTAARDILRQGHTLKIEKAKDEIRKVFLTAGLSDLLL
jgi:anti-anti-sigma factor